MDFILQPLNLVTFFPLVGVLILLFLKKEQKNAARWIALVTSLVTFGISLWVLAQFNAANTGLQMEINATWFSFGDWEIKYALGVDGLSILLVLLTTFLTPISILSTWTAVEDRVRDFMIFFLLLEIGHDRRLPGAGPVPVLRLLGVHPGADVFPDRDLGRRSSACTRRSSSSCTPWPARS